MRRSIVRSIVIAVIFLFLGVGVAAAVVAYIPDPGSIPAVYDDFNFSSTSNGFWHVNAVGAKATIKHSLLTLSGHSIELDRRLQTDPYVTVVVAKVRGIHFHKFGMGLGVFHAGTLGLEFDDDGVKCGRGTDVGWKVDYMKPWSTPPSNQWVYLETRVVNPYPTLKQQQAADKLSPTKRKRVVLTCSMYDATGRLVTTLTPTVPPPNAHYDGLDETFLRTWDSRNQYQIDWFYAGPLSGSPLSTRRP